MMMNERSLVLTTVLMLASAAGAGTPLVRSDKANVIAFPAREARFVRFVVHATTGSQPCIDELEVYGPDGERNLALAKHDARASASSCLTGYAKHAIPHLNDGRYGNDYSWIAATDQREWAQIELPKAAVVAKVVFSRDRRREYADRMPTRFEVQLSMDGKQWATVKQVAAKAAAVAVRQGRRGRGGFSGVVAAPPPPPRVGKHGVTVAAESPADLKTPAKDGLGFANLALNPEAKPAASSALTGHAIHKIAHLNDGLGGNSHSWISGGEPAWAEIDLGDVYWVYCVAFGSDSSRHYRDRAATAFSIMVTTEYDRDVNAKTWRTVWRDDGGLPIHARTPFKFEPVQARWVRIAISAANSTGVRIDELEVYGQKAPIPLDKIGPLPEPVEAEGDNEKLLKYCFLGEEHAWLKTYGHADLSPRLVPYNGRVKEYPRHIGDDRVPLPPLASAPKLDGKLDDPCWGRASRGVARVAWPYDFELGPLVEHVVLAGRKDDDLFLAIRMKRLLSAHVTVVSRADGEGCGVVAYTKNGLVFNTYEPEGRRGTKLKNSTPIEGAHDETLTCWEIRLPLGLFPECESAGLRVGLGMGGRHTAPAGRPVHFVASSLAIAEKTPCVSRTFRVRLTASGHEPVKVSGDAPGLEDGISLGPGQSRVLSIAAGRGPLGPQLKLTLDEEGGEVYALHLFRYDPLERTATLMAEMIDRFAAKGLDVSPERKQLAALRERQAELLGRWEPDRAAERQAFFAARLAKRRLFLREPDLAPIENILFVKRFPFHPSHNYSVLLDSRYRGGGGVCTLHVPRRDGRFEPREAKVVELFKSGGGIARNPMASFDLTKIYFGYRPTRDGYYHIMEMNPDGTGRRKLTDGPFHDFWPCPLPDGGLAFISTRCKARYLCWRPQVFVLFRMEADGSNLRPLSHANLSEWAPSVMSDGRLIWTRSEYLDKGADFGHTLWSIRPDGTMPRLVFGNDIIQPNGYANGRMVPGTNEVCCTLISHFGDLNGPIALCDIDKGRFNPEAITSLTPEVPWPGSWPRSECFRDAVPVARDYFLCAHAPGERFGLFVIDRYGNREVLYIDMNMGSMCPTLYRSVPRPPVLGNAVKVSSVEQPMAQFVLVDVYRGLEGFVERGTVRYIRVAQEVRADLERLPDGSCRADHNPFLDFYATPIHKVKGPYGWTSYVAKGSHGLVPVEEDGSASFYAPAGKVLYFQALDENLNEIQRMRSVVQLQPGEKRSCIGCHESRRTAPPNQLPMAFGHPPRQLDPPPWGAGPFAYEKAVQPVLDRHCVRCHDAKHKRQIDLTGELDRDRVPHSYRTLVSQGWVHYLDYGWNSGGTEKRDPLTFGVVKSRLWPVLNAGHNKVELTRDEMRAIKCWIDLNCPLWPDYRFRPKRPVKRVALTR